jgi:hypothetical protein
MTLPTLALWLNAWRVEMAQVAGLSLGLLISVVVFLTIASRHTLVAISITAVLGVIWVASAYLARALHWKRWLVVGLILFLGIVIGIVVAASNPGLLKKAVSLPIALGNSVNRLEVTQGMLSLIGDYPYTGAGLESFPGHYSTYYLLTPNYIIPHSYNLYTDVAFEQGIIALLSLLWVMLISIILLLIYGKSLACPSRPSLAIPQPLLCYRTQFLR